ncbi:hypothetical protein [Edaphocola aurantiacus]|uniref:hypothetical protein n=1 Tax=Edaphocola aurantiacus TaxID=2601682 RepID=UPI001C968BA5|nr:hypothetical protein [Edaphocola aurantiacus]
MKAAVRLDAHINTDAVIAGIVARNPGAEEDIERIKEQTFIKALLFFLADKAFDFIIGLIQKFLIRKYGIS